MKSVLSMRASLAWRTWKPSWRLTALLVWYVILHLFCDWMLTKIIKIAGRIHRPKPEEIPCQWPPRRHCLCGWCWRGQERQAHQLLFEETREGRGNLWRKGPLRRRWFERPSFRPRCPWREGTRPHPGSQERSVLQILWCLQWYVATGLNAFFKAC